MQLKNFRYNPFNIKEATAVFALTYIFSIMCFVRIFFCESSKVRLCIDTEMAVTNTSFYPFILLSMQGLIL